MTEAVSPRDMLNGSINEADKIRVLSELVDDLLSRACDGEEAQRCTTQAHVLASQLGTMAAALTDRLETVFSGLKP